MAQRWSNNPYTTHQVPSYYAHNRLYPGAYTKNQAGARTSRRMHEGMSLPVNYGLDTTSDDLNSSPYSSPYYVNGRYFADNLVTQRGNASSVQGTKYLLSVHDEPDATTTTLADREGDTADSLTETTVTIYQGKQIRFTVPYSGKVVATTIRLRNTGLSNGLLSLYLSATPGGAPIYEVAVDLRKVSKTTFETVTLRGNTPISATANRRGVLYARMEVWDDIDPERSPNPFNRHLPVEIAATGKNNHTYCEYHLADKNTPIREEYNYQSGVGCPLVGLTYNSYTSVPVERLDVEKIGATVSLGGRAYGVFCCKNDSQAEMLIYDRENNTIISGTNIKLDARTTQICLAQVTDTDARTWVFYTDGYSPLQKFRVGEWRSTAFAVGNAENITANIDAETWYNSPLGSTTGVYVFTYTLSGWEYNEQVVDLATYGLSLSGGSPAEAATITVSYTVTEGGTKNIESVEYVDARPVNSPSIIMFHNNRLYLTGFRGDRNLVQVSAIEAKGPNFNTFPYRFYAPNRSPYDTSRNNIVTLTEVASDQIMISFKNGFSIYSTYSANKSTGLEDGTPTQVSTYTDSAGVQSMGDIVNYKGIIYSFDVKEGIRRFTGALWNRLPNSVDSHFDRVDMDRPRKLWGYANKLYFNYYDKIDGKAKCLIWDMTMDYQQYPWFQDSDVPFCDIRSDETRELLGIHPDYPCIVQHYSEDVWHRLDSPIVFERHTKYLTAPGNATDMVVKRIHIKVLADDERFWYFGVSTDKALLRQTRGKDITYRVPCWATEIEDEPVEMPFADQDIYEDNATARLSLSPMRLHCESVQLKARTKTFRSQASMVSVLVEMQPRQYN